MGAVVPALTLRYVVLVCAVPAGVVSVHKAIDNFLFGLAFGLGFSIAGNVLAFLAQFIHR